jgi:hypothetical protein
VYQKSDWEDAQKPLISFPPDLKGAKYAANEPFTVPKPIRDRKIADL